MRSEIQPHLDLDCEVSQTHISYIVALNIQYEESIFTYVQVTGNVSVLKNLL